MTPCKKASYPNEEVAINAILKIRLRSTRQIKPVRAYLCECGMWHSTSYTLTVEAQNAIYKLNQEIAQLKTKCEELKNINKKYMLKTNNHCKKLNKQTEMIKKNELINKKNKTIKMLRETISDLIYKLNQLEK